MPSDTLKEQSNHKPYDATIFPRLDNLGTSLETQESAVDSKGLYNEFQFTSK